jgi:hypothetical protein
MLQQDRQPHGALACALATSLLWCGLLEYYCGPALRHCICMHGTVFCVALYFSQAICRFHNSAVHRPGWQCLSAYGGGVSCSFMADWSCTAILHVCHAKCAQNAALHLHCTAWTAAQAAHRLTQTVCVAHGQLLRGGTCRVRCLTAAAGFFLTFDSV